MLFQTFLLTGFRSEEVATLSWSNIHHATRKISVSAKPQWNFTPKSYEIRSVEVPSVKHFLDVLDELNRIGVEYISFRENIDTGGPLGRAIVLRKQEHAA